MVTSESINEIAGALAKAQGEMAPAVKDAMNPAFRSKYADLAAVWAACCPALTKHQIATVQDATLCERGVSVTTRLIHATGQWMEFGPLTVPMSKQDAHGVGSATTYARRYGLSAALGIVADDDDGNAAVQGNGEPTKAVPAKAKLVKPAGFDDWRVTLKASAESGKLALKEVWQKASAEYRTYLNTIDPLALDALKAIADKAEAA